MFEPVHVNSFSEALRGTLSSFAMGSIIFLGLVLAYNIYLAFKNGTSK